MTLISIHRQDLLHQIDMQSKGCDIPDSLTLEGPEVDGIILVPPLEKDFPGVRDAFTTAQFNILNFLYENAGNVVAKHRMFCFLRPTGRERTVTGSGMQNTLSVHIKNIRPRLKRAEMPFSIRTDRCVGYTLIKHQRSPL